MSWLRSHDDVEQCDSESKHTVYKHQELRVFELTLIVCRVPAREGDAPKRSERWKQTFLKSAL